ncbi:CGNR zinc finger domain-containing protein [Streptacidiphilus pinicola]|uniref:CGNR zinc finger domain-containing protein n=1 Tax=Streptacidiphilus pinicola TaxID=2219663 RepID=A0A2X0JGU5_9ACTN|nr:CGNR zinc finger domain-containing protein [Streptacidiphilus pinicola]
MIDLANAVRSQPNLPRSTAVRLLGRHGERAEDLTQATLTDEDLRGLRDAALRMGGILAESDTDRAALALNVLLAEHAGAPRLSRHEGHPWHLHVDRGDDASWAEWFLASSALALARILTEHGRATWGECAAANCRTLYLGTGPGSPRRYCSTTCASRARVADHRRRRAEAEAEPDRP